MSYYRQGPYGPSGPRIAIGVPGLSPCVKALIIANAAVWLVEFAAGLAGQDMALIRLFGVVPSRFIIGMVWQPLTYMFLHSPTDPFHLLLNMLMLWMFGGELERFWGSREFLRYYLICGAGGGVSAVLLASALPLFQVGPEAARVAMETPTIGASGALFGLFVAYGIVFAERTILFMLIFPMKARTMAVLMVALNLIYLIGQPTTSRVSFIAHLGGALTGFLYLRRIWRVGEFWRDLRWRLRRRRFRVMPPRDSGDRWLN